MRVAIMGTGYVGLVTGAGLAEMGNKVTCMDTDASKVDMLKNRKIPIYEPNLEEMVSRNISSENLQFTIDAKLAIENNDIVMIAVGTPPGEDGSCDIKTVEAVAKIIGQFINSYKVIVTKSTVPIGTADRVREIIQNEINERGLNYDFDVASNPEFLKEGAAVNDFMFPDRIIVGSDTDKAKGVLDQLYAPFNRRENTTIHMDIRSAEMTKYAANAMLATKISFINEIAQVCDRVGADVSMVRQGIGSDKRIGYHFIYPGLGYGGSCFPKDVKALIATARELDISMDLLNAVNKVNLQQRNIFIDRVLNYFGSSIQGKTIALWGLAFKPETDDIREAPAIDIISNLTANGAKIVGFDPAASDHMAKTFEGNENFSIVSNHYNALEGADALILATEWKIFRSPDFDRMKSSMNQPLIFDGRNQYNPSLMRSQGFLYYSVGRP